MSDLDWSLAPEGAVDLRVRDKYIVRFFNDADELWDYDQWESPDISVWTTIATRPEIETRNCIEVRFFDEEKRKRVTDAIYNWGLPDEPAAEPRKTVEDAVDDFKEVWPDSLAAGGCSDVLVFDAERNAYYCFSECWRGAKHWYQVCTREEFEACAASKKAESEPEWTHTLDSIRCEILTDEPDLTGYIVVKREADGYTLCRRSELKPIKTPITKVAAFDLLNGTPGLTLEKLHEQYEVEEGNV